MTFFYFGAALLIVLALFFSTWPLLRAKRKSSIEPENQQALSRQQANLRLHQSQVQEFEQQLTAGDIDQKQFESLQIESARSLLGDNPSSDEHDSLEKSKKALFRPIHWVLIVLCIPVLSFLLYQQLGSQNAWSLKQAIDNKNHLEQQWLSTQSEGVALDLRSARQQLVGVLNPHIKRHPEDLDSHVLLAREFMALGGHPQAIEHYQQILEKAPEATQIMAELAQAIFVQAGNRAVPVVGMLAEKALSGDPNNVIALGLVGINAYQNEQYQKAIDTWQRAVELQPSTSPNRQALENGVRQAKARLVDLGQPASQDDSEIPLHDIESKSLKVAVSLASGVSIDKNLPVFIYARAWQGAKIPLAIQRFSVGDLPMMVTLDESMAMQQGLTIDSVEQLEVIARVSPSGDAIAKSGDWQVSAGPVRAEVNQSTVYPLVISEQIP